MARHFRRSITRGPGLTFQEVWRLPDTNSSAGAAATRKKIIVLITDGGIDLGTPQKDRDRKDWLQSAVMPAVIRQGVRVFGIAVAKDADVELVQRMTTATGGTYYQVTDGGELSGVFDAITARLQDLRLKQQAATDAVRKADADRQRLAEESARLAQRETAAAETDRHITEAAHEAETRAAADRRLTVWSVVAGVAAFAAIVMTVMMRRRSPKIAVPEARLMDVSGQTGSPEHAIKGLITRIGRLEGQEIRIDGDGVSRTHAIIEYKDGGFWLRDLRSKNHTYLNNQQLPGDDTAGRVLKHGDELRFGPYLFVFLVDDLVRAKQAPNPVAATRLFTGSAEPDHGLPQEFVTRPGQPPDLGGVTDPGELTESRPTILKPRSDPRGSVGSDAARDSQRSRSDKVA